MQYIEKPYRDYLHNCCSTYIKNKPQDYAPLYCKTDFTASFGILSFNILYQKRQLTCIISLRSYLNFFLDRFLDPERRNECIGFTLYLCGFLCLSSLYGAIKIIYPWGWSSGQLFIGVENCRIFCCCSDLYR